MVLQRDNERLSEIRERQQATVKRFQERQKLRETAVRDGAPSAPAKEESLFGKLFKEEIGGVSNLVGLFSMGNASNLQNEQLERMDKYVQLYKKTTNPTTKQHIRNIMSDEYDRTKDTVFEEIVPSARKTTSQAVGEIASAALLATPYVEANIMRKAGTKFFQKTLAAAGIGGVQTGVKLGVAQEGEIADKAPNIAMMAGFGAAGNAVLVGVLPATVNALKAPVKRALDKINIGRFAGKQETTTIMPVVRETMEKVDVVKPITAQRVKGLTGIERDVLKLDTKLYKLENEFDDLVLGDKNFISKTIGTKVPSADIAQDVTRLRAAVTASEAKMAWMKKVSNTTVSSVSRSQIKEELGKATSFRAQLKNKESALKKIADRTVKTTEDIDIEKVIRDKGAEISKMKKDLGAMRIRQERLGEKAVLNQLKVGNDIYSDELGKFKIVQFVPDKQTGKVLTIAQDYNGRPVTLTSDDVLGMNKITKVQEERLVAFDNLAEVEAPVVRGNALKMLDGLRSYIKTTSKHLDIMGKSGQQLQLIMSATLDGTRRYTGRAMEPMHQLITKLGLTKKTPLQKEQVKNIIDILDYGLRNGISDINKVYQKIQPTDDIVRQFTRQFSDTTKKLVTKADKLGLKVRNQGTGKSRAIGEAKVHYPRILKDTDKFAKHREEIIALQMTRYKIPREEAMRMVTRFESGLVNSRYSGIEQARTLRLEGFEELDKFGFEVNPISVLDDFVSGASRRIVEAKTFGTGDQLISKLIDNIKREGYDSSIAEEIFNRYVGKKLTSESRRATLAGIRRFETVASLPLALFANALQPVNTASLFGTKNLLKSFHIYLKDRVGAQASARLSGVSDKMILEAAQIDGGTEQIAGEALKNFFFTPIEKFNRTLTVVQARLFAKESITKLLLNPNNPKLVRTLQKIVPNLDEVLKRGKITEGELRVAGTKGVNLTQFRGSVLDMPLFWSGDHGKVVMQFKSFAWQQGNFINDTIISEMKHGNMHPLLTYLILSQIGGEAVKGIKDSLKGDFDFRKDETLLRRALENSMTVGGFGLVADAFQTMYKVADGHYWASTGDFLGGPAGGDIASLLDGIAKASAGDPEPLAKLIGRKASLGVLVKEIRDIPGSGIILRVLGDLVANKTFE